MPIRNISMLNDKQLVWEFWRRCPVLRNLLSKFNTSLWCWLYGGTRIRQNTNRTGDYINFDSKCNKSSLISTGVFGPAAHLDRSVYDEIAKYGLGGVKPNSLLAPPDELRRQIGLDSESC